MPGRSAVRLTSTRGKLGRTVAVFATVTAFLAVVPASPAAAVITDWFLSFPAGACPAPDCPATVLGAFSLTIGAPASLPSVATGSDALAGTNAAPAGVGAEMTASWPVSADLALTLDLVQVASAQRAISSLGVVQAQAVTGEGYRAVASYTFAHCTIPAYQLSYSGGATEMWDVQVTFACQSLTTRTGGSVPTLTTSGGKIGNTEPLLSFPAGACPAPDCPATIESPAFSLSLTAPAASAGNAAASLVATWGLVPSDAAVSLDVMGMSPQQRVLATLGVQVKAVAGPLESLFTLENCTVPGSVLSEGSILQATFDCGSVVVLPPTNANLIVNGNFSQPAQVSVPYWETVYASAQKLSTGLPVIPGWTVGPNSVDMIGSKHFAPPAGLSPASQSVDLSGAAPGSITQTVGTTPGSSYLLKWYASANPECGQVTRIMHVLWDNKLVASLTVNTADITDKDMGWTLHEQVVAASSAQSKLEFKDATGGSSPCGPVVAGVALTASPPK